MNNKITLILDNIRSAQNVGSLFRTAECLGVSKIYICGYSPYPLQKNDSRLPHIALKNDQMINKTALGATRFIKWSYFPDTLKLISKLRKEKYFIVSLEQNSNSIKLKDFKISNTKVGLIVGNEISGLSNSILKESDQIVEIEMAGKKESLNVVQASAIAIYSILNL